MYIVYIYIIILTTIVFVWRRTSFVDQKGLIFLLNLFQVDNLFWGFFGNVAMLESTT